MRGYSRSSVRSRRARLLLVTLLALALAGASAAEEGGAWLGVAVVADGGAPGSGVQVAHVLPGGPAEAAGLEPDDLIRAVGDRQVARYADLSAALAERRAGDHVVLRVVREGEELSLEVALGERQRQTLYYLEPELLLPLELEQLNQEALARSVEAMRRAVARQRDLREHYSLRWRAASAMPGGGAALPVEFWGVDLSALTPELRVHFGAPDEAGVLVSRVARDGVAESAGVRVGDVLFQLGEQPLGSWDDLLIALRGEEESSVPLLVARPEGTVELEIPVGELAGDERLLASLLLPSSERATRELELRIQELEAKIRVLEAALARKHGEDAER